MADSRVRGLTEIGLLPAMPAKKAMPHRHGVAHWIEQDGRVWLIRRPEKGMLGGMRALPGGEWSGTPPAASELGESGLAQVDPGFNHFDLRLTLVRSATQIGRASWRDSVCQYV